VRRRRVEEEGRLERLEDALESVKVALERIELMFLMKDPSVAAGADAYEGLRRSLILAREDRMARLVDLARIDASLQRSDAEGDPGGILDELLASAGVSRIDGPINHDRFDIFGESVDGAELVLLEPAYVHTESDAVIRSGRARYELLVVPTPADDHAEPGDLEPDDLEPDDLEPDDLESDDVDGETVDAAIGDDAVDDDTAEQPGDAEESS
jgi:hypothetical protein